jgi:hypothetical protein
VNLAFRVTLDHQEEMGKMDKMDKQDQRDIQDQRGAKVIKGIVGMMVMLETQVKRGKKVRMITLCANDFRKSPFY